MKRNLNKTSYLFNGYLVTIQLTHSTNAGAPVYAADITRVDNIESAVKNWGSVVTASYTFKGHFDSERSEAKYILDAHISKTI